MTAFSPKEIQNNAITIRVNTGNSIGDLWEKVNNKLSFDIISNHSRNYDNINIKGDRFLTKRIIMLQGWWLAGCQI